MPVSEAPYKRTYKHTKKRGRETTVICDGCGRQVPRYKTFVIRKRFRINDPIIAKQIDARMVHLLERTLRFCPSCARFRGISQPGKSVRKKHRRK